MKFSLAIFLASAASSSAFAPGATGRASTFMNGGMSSDIGIPCEDECALESFPNLPETVHPGVLSGKAMVDLLQHAKDNGKCVDEILNLWKRMNLWIVVSDVPLTQIDLYLVL